MGEFEIEGDGVASGLDALISSKPSTLAVGRCRYGMMLNEKGGVIDDVITYRLDEQKFMLVVNASTAEGDLSHLRAHLPGSVVITDRSAELAKLDLQGPLSFDVLADQLGYENLSLKYFSFCQIDDVLVSRTGYTGELGVELYLPVAKAKEVWNKLLEDERVLPVGLGARDTLRLECALSLYGHELSEEMPASYCGIRRFLSSEGGYVGAEALASLKDEDAFETIGLKSPNKSAPRAGEKVLCDGEIVGEVTSGSYSPTLGYGIALAQVRQAVAERATFEVDRGRRKVAVERVLTLPFYQKGTVRLKMT
jgi:aminomethyltransferase